MSYFVFKGTNVLDVYVAPCLGLLPGAMGVVLALVAHLVTWRLRRQACENMGLGFREVQDTTINVCQGQAHSVLQDFSAVASS